MCCLLYITSHVVVIIACCSRCRRGQIKCVCGGGGGGEVRACVRARVCVRARASFFSVFVVVLLLKDFKGVDKWSRDKQIMSA